MKIINISQPVTKTDNLNKKDQIHLLTQFFIHRDPKRNTELKICLKKNSNNQHISKIHLLNEKIFNPRELGVNSDKICQKNIKERLTYQAIFKYVRENKLKGYIIFANSDIFFDETIGNLRVSTLDKQKQFYTLLRYEYDNKDTKTSPIFGPRFDSQDTWIYHTNFPILETQEPIFNYQFGQPGCDNKFIYLINILGYQPVNDPTFIKTYHFHRDTSRAYTDANVIQPPWGIATPTSYEIESLLPSMGIDMSLVSKTTKGFKEMNFADNDVIRQFIIDKFNCGKQFIVPRVAGVENNFAVFAHIVKTQGGIHPSLQEYFRNMSPTMKKNAGIYVPNMDVIIKYSDLYLSAFDHCEMFSGWESWGNVMPGIQQSYCELLKMYPSKNIVWSFALDIFHYIYTNPWTLALKGKKLLIVSSFEESIKEKIPIRKHLYGIDLFPECHIITIKPPMTQADEPTREFDVELMEFFSRLDLIKDQYDVALVSAGGYGNLICDHIYQSGKSSIYIGGVLQMYFGILGQRWIDERPDVVKLFFNKHWSRPKPHERPKKFDGIENGCYW